jgi:transposase
MSTSLLYHAFGLVGYQHVRASYAHGRVTFRVRPARDTHRCPTCRSAAVWSQGAVEREFRTLPIGSKPVILQVAVPRVLCFACGTTRQVRLSFAAPRKRYTRAFERYALELARHMTIQAVARHLQVSWDTIKEILASAGRDWRS